MRIRLSTTALALGMGEAMLAVALLLSVSGCGGEHPQAGAPQGPPPAAVEVLAVSSEAFVERIDGVGELRAVNAVEIQSEIAGIIESIEFDEGQEVKAGTVLFRLRDGEQQARLAEGHARVALAKDQFERTQRLAVRNAAAEAQLERHRAELDMAKAQLSLARVELQRTRITAPFSGHLGRRLVSPGARIEPDDELVRLDTINPIDMVTTVPEAALTTVKIGARLNLEVAAYPGRAFPAEIIFVAPSVEEAIRRVPIKARADNPEALLRPGMFADLRVELGSRETILVPVESVLHDPEGAFVWRVIDGEAIERAPVELGAREGGRVEIRHGLETGDRVVTAGTHKVYPGAVVNSVDSPKATASEIRLQPGDGDGA